MELPTRTSPGNYIAILKVCHVFMYSLLHCLSGFCSPLGKSRLLTSLWGKHTSEALGVVGCKANTTQAGQCLELVAGDTTPYRCPWVIFTILKLCSLGKEGACKTCKSGALRQNILPGFFKKKNRRLKVDLRFSIVVLF